MLLLIDSKKYYSQHIQINSVTMKNILAILSVVTAFLCISCDDEEHEQLIYTRRTFTQHCIQSYIRPASSDFFDVVFESIDSLDSTNSNIKLGFTFGAGDSISKHYIDYNSVYDDKYLDYASFYNDLSYNSYFGPFEPIDCSIVSRFPLIKIEAVTQTDYNENYPAKSSLNEIGRLVYLDGVSYIANDYGRKYDENGELIEISEYYELLQEKKFNDISAEESIALLDIECSHIEFDEQPSKGVHVIQFKFTFGPDPVTNETIMPVYGNAVFAID